MTELRLGMVILAFAWSILAAIPASAAEDGAPGGVSVNLPVFDYTAAFVSPAGGGLLRAEETGAFRIELRNLEAKPYKEVRISFQALTPLEGLAPSGAITLAELPPGDRRVVELPISADRGTPSGTADYVIEVLAEGGAYGPPTRVSFRTRAFVPPRFEILAVDNARVAGDRLVVKAQIQNIGGPARDVSARFVTDAAIGLVSDPLPLGDLGNGQVREVAVELPVPAVGPDQPELPVWLEVNERHADLGIRELFTISLRENEGLTKRATQSAP
ncbi:MAG: hypothetical protein FJZ01_14030 [Candidatus Sericytochromatia bacterium]|nr:hypothetical protein [Candidatus Tanganyikabacteria bacterium]